MSRPDASVIATPAAQSSTSCSAVTSNSTARLVPDGYTGCYRPSLPKVRGLQT